MTDKTLWWHNYRGWIDNKHQATKYSPEEIRNLRPPIGGYWWRKGTKLQAVEEALEFEE